MVAPKGTTYPWDGKASQDWTCDKLMAESRNSMEEAKDQITGDYLDPSDKLKAAHVLAMLAVAAAIRDR